MESTSLLQSVSDSLANAVERAAKSTVSVNARRRMPASGIVWSDTLIVTANHVVERFEDITVALVHGESVPAKLVGRDPGADIALLAIDAPLGTAFTHASSPGRPGELVLAIGQPAPGRPMTSLGVVSGILPSVRTQTGATVEGILQPSVAMLPGFSGGPLVNAAGELLGLNSSTLVKSGAATIPVDALGPIVEILLQHGRPRRGYLGVGVQAVALPASVASEHQDHGLVVTGVETGSPGEASGLIIGDVLLTLDDRPLQSVDNLLDALTGDTVGRESALAILRGGVPQTVGVTIGERGAQ